MSKLLIEMILKIINFLIRRPSLKIRIMEDDPELKVGNLVFEIENTSQAMTSLLPNIESLFLFPERGILRKGHAYYDVRESDRQLPPYQPKIFTASARGLPNAYLFSWFRVFYFRPTTGRVARVYIRNALLEQIGFFRFHFERLRFHLSGELKDYGGITIEEYETKKRSQGPH